MEQRKTNENLHEGLLTESGGQQETQNKPVRKRKRISINRDSRAQLPVYSTSGTHKEPEDKEIEIDEVVKEPDFEPTAVFNKENSEVPTEPGGDGNNNTEEKNPDDRDQGE